MGHNSVVTGHPKCTGISRVDGLSMGPLDLGRHKFGLMFFIEVVSAIVNLMVGF